MLKRIRALDNTMERMALGMMYIDSACDMTSATGKRRATGQVGADGSEYRVVPLPEAAAFILLAPFE